VSTKRTAVGAAPAEVGDELGVDGGALVTVGCVEAALEGTGLALGVAANGTQAANRRAMVASCVEVRTPRRYAAATPPDNALTASRVGSTRS
jgi:hypothetical protein